MLSVCGYDLNTPRQDIVFPLAIDAIGKKSLVADYYQTVWNNEAGSAYYLQGHDVDDPQKMPSVVRALL